MVSLYLSWLRNLLKFSITEQKVVESGEFVCPGETVKDENGQVVPHPKYADPENCEKFFLCLNGVEKRELRCDKGEVFNEDTTQCDEPKNVPGW